jgi:ferrous iron transport protein B
MNSPKWFWAAISYQCGLAYVVSLCVYQFGMILLNGAGSFGVGTIAAFLLTAGFLYLLFRRRAAAANTPQALRIQGA